MQGCKGSTVTAPRNQMASGPRSPVRIRMQSSSGRMKILPSPIRPSGPERAASMIAFTVGSTKYSGKVNGPSMEGTGGRGGAWKATRGGL